MAHLATGLDPARFEVHVARLQEAGPLYGEMAACGLPLSAYPIRSFLRPGTLHQQWRFATYLKRQAIDIVHAYGFYPIVFAVPVARLAGTRGVLASIRDTGVYQTPMQKQVQKMACRLAHRVVVNAEAIRSWLVSDGYRRDRIVVIRNGVDLGGFRRPRDAREVRREIDVPSDAPLVVVVSRLHELKGLDDFLDAAAILLARRRDAHFLIVGERFRARCGEWERDGVYQQVLERQARRLGIADRVHFTGFRLDVPALLAASTVSVLPSLSEGLSNTVLESMAAGIPVV
ncbi:MAG TPA: glycosyltransferase, partial [Dongiaceae bacterium]|nr:glycosyltransferase [Dongiaceae bacterium]